MGYPRQIPTLKRLEAESFSAVRGFERQELNARYKLFQQGQNALKDLIAREYRQAFGRENWNLAQARNNGSLYRMERGIRIIMDNMKSALLTESAKSFSRIYRYQQLRSAWILDQVTPQGINPKLGKAMKESANVFTGAAAKTKWYERWALWSDYYASSLSRNLAFSASAENDLSAAMQTVDSTKAGAIPTDLWTAFARLFTSEAIARESEARDAIAEANQSIALDEIWQTMEDEGVCEICGPLDGLTRQEVEDRDEFDPPAHPNCRCYYRIVPRQYRELLRRVDPALARSLDSRGLVPDALAIRDDSGNIKAALIVNFNEWVESKGYAISGR